MDEMEHIEISFPGGLLTTNEEINRVQIIFDDTPDEATRAKLKANGFRWAPREGAWRRSGRRRPWPPQSGCSVLQRKGETECLSRD